MAHRLMVICLGGLAGAGALVCCDLDEGLDDEVEAAPEDEIADHSEDIAPAAAEAEPAPVH